MVRGLEDAAAFKEKVLELTGGKGAAGVLECVAGDMPAIVSTGPQKALATRGTR